jgi:hypothetical protein
MTDLIDRIVSIQQAMTADEASPADVRKWEMQLCGFMGTFAREATLAEIEFKKVIAASRIGAKSIAEAKVVAEAQPAYGTWRLADMNHTQCHQMVMTCRNHGRSLSEEMRLQR